MPVRGTYALLLKASRPIELVVGSLGVKSLQPGHYCYVGSALGRSVTVDGRVGRYLRLKAKAAPLRWHIDYVVKSRDVSIESVYVLEGQRAECEAARRISMQATPIAGVGCSDCRCKTHLFLVDKEALERLLMGMGFTGPLKLPDPSRGQPL